MGCYFEVFTLVEERQLYETLQHMQTEVAASKNCHSGRTLQVGNKDDLFP